jgi:hypothetical protein
MCPDSDVFAMNRLEEGALGDPVLAGNLVLNPNGRRSPRMGLQRQIHRKDGSSGIDSMPCSTGPSRLAGPTARTRVGPALRAKC